MAVPSGRNISWKTTEKLSKYEDLEIKTTRMWGMKTEITLVTFVMGALGLIKKGLQKHKEKNPSGNQHQWATKNDFMKNRAHAKEDFVLKAKFISPVVP